MPESDQYFRAGVGALISDGRDRVLAFERAALPGAWQLPQGGIHAGEEPDQALWREVGEETGLTSAELSVLGRYPELLAYELPPEARSPKTGRGQVQYWYLLRCADPEGIVVRLGVEFKAWQWASLAWVIERTAAFRRPVYEKLLAHLRVQGAVPGR